MFILPNAIHISHKNVSLVVMRACWPSTVKSCFWIGWNVLKVKHKRKQARQLKNGFSSKKKNGKRTPRHYIIIFFVYMNGEISLEWIVFLSWYYKRYFVCITQSLIVIGYIYQCLFFKRNVGCVGKGYLPN